MIPLRYQPGNERAHRLDSTLDLDHPLVGTDCPACDIRYEGGEQLALVYIGPGDNYAEQRKAANGQLHVGAAVCVHAACAGMT